ncbi:MAG: NAD(P)H-dependent oxidoreductase [Eubacteriales bacterium]|nr:NAD(P)H-dependent oxidoreductase [Eubacteriales bacterium]
MKKIIAFIGSSKGEKSSTAQFARLILENVLEIYEGETDFEVITSDKVNIKPCRSCLNCFRYCQCPQDKDDDMTAIKEKLLEADFIIWGSPVYAHQVSGQMKTLIDRLSYWLHIYKLAGKPGMVLATTSSTGHIEVLSYLAKIMLYLGMKAVKGYWVITDFQGLTPCEEDMQKKGKEAAAVIADYLSGKKKVTASPVSEKIFKALKSSILLSRKEKPGEYEIWEKEGYFECDSFSDLLEKKGV